MSSISFKRGTNSITINTPQFGYKTEIHMAMKRGDRLASGLYPWFDNGKDYDHRLFIAEFILNASQQKELQDFFSDDAKGRGAGVNGIQLKVPKGIFPFGPDLGDGERRFMVALGSSDFSGAQRRPWLNFTSRLVFVLKSAPDYDVKDQVSETKAVTIGNIDNLRYPRAGYAPDTNYAVDSIVTHGGVVRTLDRTAGGDWYTTRFLLIENAAKTAQLVKYLQSTARATAFTLWVQKNSFVFGRDNSDAAFKEGAGTYTVNLLDNVIKISHTKLHQFSTDISLSMRSYNP